MANGYIGKISAVVTANTSDLSRKLSGAVGDVDKFANGLEVSLRRIEKTGAQSFERLFTPLQNLERKFATALKFNIRTEEQVTKLRQLTSVAEEVNKPLSTAVSSFSKLSLEIQGAFLPALDRAQTAAVNLSTTLDQQGSVSERSFGQVKQIVDQTTASIKRLAQAQQLASQSFSGNELQFANPRLFETLSRGATLTQRAAALPANALDNGDIARQVQLLQQYQNAAVEADARVSALRLTPDVDPEVILAAERRLNSLTQTALRAQERLGNAIEVSQNVGASTQLFSTTDGSGRSIQERVQAIARLRQQEEAAAEATRRAAEAQEEAAAAAQRRADVATRLLNVLQQESTILSNVGAVSTTDATGRSIQERVEAIARLRQQEEAAAEATRRAAEAQEEAAAAAQRRADVATSLLNVLQQESTLLSNEGAASTTDATGRSIQERVQAIARLRDEPQRRLEQNQGASTRLIDRLGPSVNALRDRVADLAEPLRATVGPEVDRLNNRFRILAREGVPAASGSVQRLRADIQSLNAVLDSRRAIGDNFLESFGGGGAAGLGLGVDSRALREAGGQIEFVQQRLSRLGAEARGPTLQALQNFREVAQRLFDAGSIDTESGRAELAALRRELAATLSAAGGGSQGRILQDLNRAGDIARGGVDRLSLGLQQAAFAVDDFFSVTGGFEQRIRAVGNNLTQLGFIVGGTTGLFVALGVSLGAQAIVGIVRFINSGQAAEDQTKALNDALERQKTLADQLAESFSNLANAITTRGFSEAAKQARDFARDLESLIKLQRDAREERLVSANPRGREIDNRINSLNRRLRDTTDPGQAAAIQDQIGSLQEERRRLRQTLPGRPAPTRNEVANSIGFRGFQSNAALAQGVFLDTLGIIGSLGINQLSSGQDTRARIGAESARNAGLINPNNNAAIRAAIDARIQEINPLADQDIGFVSTINSQNRNILAAREERTRLIELQRRFEDSSFDDALRQYVESVNSAGLGLEAAQNEVTRAIEAGVPGARSLGVIIDSLSQQIDNANAAIRKAIDEFNANPTAPGAAERRDAVIAEQQGVVNRTRAQRAAVEAESDRLRRERTLNPERQFDSVLSRTQATIDRIGDPAGALRTRLRELQFQRDTVQQQLQAAPADPVLIRAEENLTASIRSLEAEVNALDETLNGFEAREARRLTGDAERGRELSLTPGERAAEQIQQGINDIIARFGEVAAETTGLVDEAGRQDAIDRFINDQLRQLAPAVFALADEVTNAILQGPSRAALGATDASTVEGQRELNRLLRGDDSNRDVDLVELQKQSNLLLETIADNTGKENQVAN